MKSNSSFNRPVVASPAPDASNGNGTVASQIAPATQVNEWGDKTLLNAGGWFKLRLTLSLKGEGIAANLAAIGNGTSGSVCPMHNGFLRWSSKFSEQARLMAWPALVPLKRQGHNYEFDMNGDPVFQKNSGLHMFWCAPASGLDAVQQDIINRFNIWASDRTKASLTPEEIAQLPVLLEKLNSNKPKMHRMDAYKLMQKWQMLPESEVPTYSKLKVMLPANITEELVELLADSAAEKQSGVLDIYVKDRFSMRSETVVDYQYKDENGTLTPLSSPNGTVQEYQYNWGSPIFVRWNPGESLWEADESRLFSQVESRRMAQSAAGEAKARGAEIELLKERIEDLLKSSGRKNKWYIRVGAIPAKVGESCAMWDSINQWGDEARNVWETTMGNWVGKLNKPFTWNSADENFTQEHLDAIMSSVGNYDAWMTACGKTVAPAPVVTPIVVVTPVATPAPTPAPVAVVPNVVASVEVSSTEQQINTMFSGLSDAFIMDDEEEDGNY